jgi:hypothetical protein
VRYQIFGLLAVQQVYEEAIIVGVVCRKFHCWFI